MSLKNRSEKSRQLVPKYVAIVVLAMVATRANLKIKMNMKATTDPLNIITNNGYSWYQNEFYRLCQIDDEKIRSRAKGRFHALNEAGTPASYWNPNEKLGYTLSFFEEFDCHNDDSHIWQSKPKPAMPANWDNAWED